MGTLERVWGGVGLSRDKDVGLSARVGLELSCGFRRDPSGFTVCPVWPGVLLSFHSGQGLRCAVLFGCPAALKLSVSLGPRAWLSV